MHLISQQSPENLWACTRLVRTILFSNCTNLCSYNNAQSITSEQLQKQRPVIDTNHGIVQPITKPAISFAGVVEIADCSIGQSDASVSCRSINQNLKRPPIFSTNCSLITEALNGPFPKQWCSTRIVGIFANRSWPPLSREREWEKHARYFEMIPIHSPIVV